MKLSFDPETLLPAVLPATMPDWAKQMGALLPVASGQYDLALLRRQQQLLRKLGARLEEQGAAPFLIEHLDNVADLLGALVTPYLKKLDTLGDNATEDIEPEWLPDFSPLPVFWQPIDPAVEVSSETVEAFDQLAGRPDVLISVAGGVAEIAYQRPSLVVEIVDYDNLGQEEAQQELNRLLGGINDPGDWIPEYPQAAEPDPEQVPVASTVQPSAVAPEQAAAATSGLSQNALILASGQNATVEDVAHVMKADQKKAKKLFKEMQGIYSPTPTLFQLALFNGENDLEKMLKSVMEARKQASANR
ncbi:hypothetical protein [Hymenobacter sp. DG01]|uniref:hypothetical protein n=1 Tax=Hymenobacter sp. DG01 TaxID=2584940 RepID=UPI0011213C94|nr:hypothetical protein [Hymenobacter sp. DG01]